MGRALICWRTILFSINSTNNEKAMRHQRIFGVATPLLFCVALLAGGSSTALAACGLQSADNRIKHVVHIQFDNVHLRRDNPNVPSDLEQVPNLLNFMQNNGTVSGNQPINGRQEGQLVRRARAIIDRAADLAHDDRDHGNDHH
jgi:hypothetical protein